jgi:hypothetical protein
MKSRRDVEKLIKSAPVHSDGDVDRSVLRQLLEGLPSSERQGSVLMKGDVLRAIAGSKIARCAAAAVVIAAIGLLLFERNGQEATENRTGTPTAKSQVEMLTGASLNAAYRRGGMEAVEDLSRRAFEMSRPRPTRLSVDGLLAELLGNGEN